ncbi:MAG: mechanosensitive ion channel [Candidatus Lokiarchaeota archaeon]|nr:mechanosensitive ion channel [Candidatus Lokiarchaeota archaeon]
MKRIYRIFIWISLIGIFILVYFYFGFEQLLLNVVLLNLVAYVLRSILIDIFHSLIKNLLVRYVITIIINITWLLFPFWLIFLISPIYFLAIISFMVVAISLTFQNTINNIVSGITLLFSGGFEVGDLVQINNIDGIIKEITLNHIKLVDFDGSITSIPNRVVFNSSVIRYTHIELKKLDKLDLGTVIKKVKKTFIGKEKLTRYVKVVELLGTVNGERIDEILEPIFKKYEPIFGIKPYSYVNNTVADRLSITFQILSKNPNSILEYLDSFLKDVLFQIYHDELYFDWNQDNKNINLVI